MKEYSKGVRQIWEKYKYVIAVVLTGVVLLAWPDMGSHPQKPDTPVQDVTAIRQELEEILGAISGVGQVQVMLTMENDGKKDLAEDTELSYSGNTEAPERYDRSSEIILKDGTSGNEPMIIQNQYPTYRGALIVCQGGNRADVKLAVTEAVMAITGLSSDRISVAKWQ